MMATLKQLQKNYTSKKMLVIDFSKPLDLLILKYVRSFEESNKQQQIRFVSTLT